jgi:hypothetical protein
MAEITEMSMSQLISLMRKCAAEIRRRSIYAEKIIDDAVSK